jgi:Zn-dependent protease
MLGLSLQDILRIVPAILIGLTVHELAHALIALRLGDDTAKQLGRVTFNPFKHIDPMGFFMLLVAGFGWAKPVLIDRKKLKNPARDDVLIALSGPAANLLLAVVLVLLLRVVIILSDFRSERTFDLVVVNFIAWISINISLGLFNLLPIPPLDGSHVILNLFPSKHAATAALYFRYGSYALLAIIVLERVAKIDILPIGRMVNSAVVLLLRLVGLH